MKVLTALLVCAFVLVTWALSAQTKDNKLNRKWMLVEYPGFTKDELTELKAYMDLSGKDNRGSANMGCNNIMFGIKTKRCNKIEFTAPGATMMYCEGRMKLEDEFGKLLPSVKKYKIEGHYLTLKAKNGTKMKFVAEDWD